MDLWLFKRLTEERKYPTEGLVKNYGENKLDPRLNNSLIYVNFMHPPPKHSKLKKNRNQTEN